MNHFGILIFGIWRQGVDWCIGFSGVPDLFDGGPSLGLASGMGGVGGDDYDSPFGVSLVEIEQVVV